MKKIGPGDCHDMHGYPIHPGDLCRQYHFTERRYRRREYLYHVAVWNEKDAAMEMVPVSELEPSRRGRGGRYWLLPGNASDLEIIHGCGPGECLDFRERKRAKLTGRQEGA